jgi:hypothetical protein
MSPDAKRAAIDAAIASVMEKRAGVFGNVVKSTWRGGAHTAGSALKGTWNALTGRTFDSAAGKVVGRGALKKELATATGDRATQLQRLVDASRFKQVLAGGAVLAGGGYAYGKVVKGIDNYDKSRYGAAPYGY